MKKAKIILLTGQSNAVGVGHCQYLPAYFSDEKIAEYMRGYENIPINYYSHDKHSDGFVKTGLNCTELTKNTFGPEVGIAEIINQKHTGEQYCIVKCAYGGTSLWHDWISPLGEAAYNPASHDDAQVPENYRDFGWCYNEMCKVLTESIALIEQEGYEPEIVAWCWMQGEADACEEQHVPHYERRYAALLADLRQGFAKCFADDCTFVDAGVSQIWPFYVQINDIKRAYAAKTPNSIYLDTIGAGLTTHKEPQPEPDIYHYDAGSTVLLGHLFAQYI